MCIKREKINEYVTLDIETTGFNPKKHKILKICMCKVKDGNIVDKFTAFVNPKQHIPQNMSEIVKITDDMVKDADTIDKVIPKVIEFIGELPVVVTYSNYVMNFINENCNNANIEFENDVIDILHICKKRIPNLKNYKLTTILEFFGYDDIVLDGLMDYTHALFKIFEIIKDLEQSM